MAKPYIVRPELTEDDVISEVRNGNLNVSDLMKRSSFQRGKIRGLISKYAPRDKITLPSRARLNPVAVALPAARPPAPAPAPPETVRAPYVQIALAGAVILISLTLGGVGLVLNWQFAVTLGQTPLSSNLLGVVGAVIDLITIFIMAVASLLWDKGRFGQFVIAIAIGIFCLALNIIASMSFAASNIGDSLQGREAVTQHRKALEGQYARVQADRVRIREDRDPQILEQEIQTARGSVPANRLASSKDCTDVTISLAVCDRLIQLRSAKRAAEQRVDLDKRLGRLADEIAALPPVAVKDPGASHLSRLTLGYIGAEDVENFRVIGFAFMPSLAGFLLAFARTLLR